jgi:hypothetical protein
MSNVSVSNVVEEYIEKSIIAIHCAKCTTDERPLFSSVVRYLYISVMKVCDQNEPEVHPQVRKEVVFQEECERVGVRYPCKECNHQTQSHVRQYHVISVLWFEDGRRGLEVVGSSSIILSKGVGEDVCPPTNGNHKNDLQQIHERRVRHQMVKVPRLH